MISRRTEMKGTPKKYCKNQSTNIGSRRQERNLQIKVIKFFLSETLESDNTEEKKILRGEQEDIKIQEASSRSHQINKNKKNLCVIKNEKKLSFLSLYFTVC